MKLTNADLAAYLRQQHADNPLLRCLAQLLLDRHTSKMWNTLALRVANLPELPEESWSRPLPSPIEAELALSVAIQSMNSEYAKSPYHAEIHARRVAWAAMTVARLLEWQRQITTQEWTRTGESPPITNYDGAPLNTAAGRAKVIDAVNAYLTQRNGT